MIDRLAAIQAGEEPSRSDYLELADAYWAVYSAAINDAARMGCPGCAFAAGGVATPATLESDGWKHYLYLPDRPMLRCRVGYLNRILAKPASAQTQGTPS